MKTERTYDRQYPYSEVIEYTELLDSALLEFFFGEGEELDLARGFGRVNDGDAGCYTLES